MAETENKSVESNKNEEKEAKRVVIRFFGENKKDHFATPPAGCTGLAVIHNPVNDPNMSQAKLGLTVKDLEKHPDLLMQLALHGASVHLRNQINTDKVESTAREALEARLSGFKAGVYRTVGEGSSRIPLVIQAFEKALVDSGQFDEATIKEKVEKHVEAWRAGDKADQVKQRAALMSNAQVRKAFTEMQTPKTETEAKLGDL